MPELCIQPQRGSAEPEPTATGYRLAAETSWLVFGSPGELDAIAGALPSRIPDRFGLGCLRLRFGNAVGRFVVPHLGTLEIHTGKWDEAHFEQMLAELTDIAASLPFAGYQSAAVPYDRSIAARHDVLYHAFVYLRHILSPAAPRHQRLVPALEAIVREPHRRFVREHQRVDTWRARRIDVASLRAIAEGRERLVRGTTARPIPGLRDGRGESRVPATVVEHFARHDLDTPENRFVKAFLDQASAIVDAVTVAFEGDRALGQRVRADVRWMRAALTPYLHASLWDDVGEMRQVPTASTVLQRRRGYRDVFHHSHKLRLGARIPLDADRIRDLLELKDIADLYELWTYFILVNALSAVLGARPMAVGAFTANDRQLFLPWDHHVRWPNGIETYYNLSFSRSAGAKRRSYSVPLRPDIALWLPASVTGSREGRGHFELFDAKFKLRRVEVALSAEQDDPNVPSSQARFKRDDLYKMHTYRDAIPQARAVRILYPGEQARFFEARDGVGGVGAMPLRPGNEADLRQLRECLAEGLRPSFAGHGEGLPVAR